MAVALKRCYEAERPRSSRILGKKKKSFSYVTSVAIVLLFIGILFSYGMFNAEALVKNRCCSELNKKTEKSQDRLQQLKAELKRKESADKATAGAVGAGMIQAQEYDYIGGVGRVASSAQ